MLFFWENMHECGTGSMVFPISIFFYGLGYIFITLSLGIEPNEKRWETFVLAFVLLLHWLYCMIFIVGKKIGIIANKYREKLGIEKVNYHE